MGIAREQQRRWRTICRVQNESGRPLQKMAAEFRVGRRPVFSFYGLNSTLERRRTGRESTRQTLTFPLRADSVLKPFGRNPRLLAASESQLCGARPCQPTKGARDHLDCRGSCAAISRGCPWRAPLSVPSVRTCSFKKSVANRPGQAAAGSAGNPGARSRLMGNHSENVPKRRRTSRADLGDAFIRVSAHSRTGCARPVPSPPNVGKQWTSASSTSLLPPPIDLLGSSRGNSRPLWVKECRSTECRSHMQFHPRPWWAHVLLRHRRRMARRCTVTVLSTFNEPGAGGSY